jgi:hypothetical protein
MRTKNTYEMSFICGNCKFSFVKEIVKGQPASGKGPCPNCGCYGGRDGIKEHAPQGPPIHGKKEILMEG